ncbi:hypothetical protein ABPG72_014364 [Tetrahymena utriculariae]
MSKCLKFICCCLQKKDKQNYQNGSKQDKLKDFERCAFDQKQKSFMFKGNLYYLQEQIGQGAFSEVYTVFNQNQKRFEVLKKLILKESIDEYIQEYNILKSIKHEFVIQFYDCLLLDEDLCFLMEYAEQGTLQQFIDNPYLLNKKIDESFILEICQGIFEGIQYLQIKKIIHRDLKPENILISDFKAKIADLGLSKFLLSKFVNTNVGNMLYAAPEKNNNEKGGYGLKSDIYSAGLILCQVILRLSVKQISQINFFDNQDSLKNIPKELKKLISLLISKNPDKRPSCDQVIQQINKFKQSQEVIEFIQNKYQFTSYKVNQKVINIEEQSDIEKQDKLNKALIDGEDEKDSIDVLSCEKIQINFGVDQTYNQDYKPENEQWFEQNFTAGAVSIVRYKDYEKGIKQFEKILNVEVRDEFMMQKKLMMVLWMMKKKKFTLQNLFSQQKMQQDYEKAKQYAEVCLQLDPLNQNCLSILVLSMIKLRYTEIEIMIQIEKLISKIYFGGLLLFMTLIDIQKYIHPSYAKSIANSSTNFNEEIILGCSIYFYSKNQLFSIQKIIFQQLNKDSQQIKVVNQLIQMLNSGNQNKNIFIEATPSTNFENDLRLGFCYYTIQHYLQQYNEMNKFSQIYSLGYQTQNNLEIEQILSDILKENEKFYEEINKMQKIYLDC